jgi:hypothetical protein
LESLEGRCLPSSVTNLNDAGAGSLRQAILDTPADGTVDFQPGLSGTITLTGGELDIRNNVSIAGPGATVITVSGNHSSTVFHIASTFTVDISGLTVADGNAILSTGGGGILNDGMLSIISSTISRNFNRYFGGGITNYGTLTVANCTLSQNSAEAGGAIDNANGVLNISDSTISANTATTSGAGIFDSGSSIAISNSTISGNLGGTFASAIVSSGATVTVSNSTISGNSPGGIANLNLNMIECTVSGNSMGDGGILNESFATLTVIGCTISGNGGAGVITDDLSTAAMKNTILAGNTSSDVSGIVNSQGHNLIGDGTGGSGYVASDLVGTTQNPIDPLLGPLQDNGGPTFTMALLPGSPAINAGDPTDAPMWDQRGPGYPRVVNGMIDIGAYEHQAIVTTITCSVADSLLWPPNHRLVNVGLSVDVQPPDATVQVQVYANDNANASDAADIGPGTLELRAARQGHGSGRVYLIVVTATSGGQTAFDVCTVVVPHDRSAGSLARVQAEAVAAEAYYREFQTAPPSYSLLGQGSTDAGGNGERSLVASIGDGLRLAFVAVVKPPTSPGQSLTAGRVAASDASGNVVGAGTAAAVDGYFALRWEERGTDADSWVPDLWRSDPLFS